MIRQLVFLTWLTVCFSSSVIAATQDEKKWEVGVALGSQYLADYRGSEEYNFKALPVPFFVYRGDRINIDRKGVRGDVIATKWWELNVSGEVSLSGGNKHNLLRRGMPELDSTVELGPSLNFSLDGSVADDGWLLRLPLRAVISVSPSKIDYVGYLANPKITYVKEDFGEGWRTSTSVGATYGDVDYHSYYYEVKPEYATEIRPEYMAVSGYSGSYFKTSLTRRIGTWRYGASVRYDNLKGTDFADNSPLVATNDYFSVSLIFAKYFWQSKD